MTQGNLSLILALPKIVVRPQIWHDNIWSQRRGEMASRNCPCFESVLYVSDATLKYSTPDRSQSCRLQYVPKLTLSMVHLSGTKF